MKDFEKIFKKNRSRLLPVVFILVSIFAIFQIIIPLIFNIVETQKTIVEKNKIIQEKKDAIRILNSISDETVNDAYTIVTTALPAQKNFVLIFDELNQVASKSNVELGGFSLNVGGIYSTENASIKNDGLEKEIEGIPYLNILISVSGLNQDVRKFADNLYKNIPIIEINKIDISKNDARYDVNFFYKTQALRPTEGFKSSHVALTDKEKNQIETLKSWSR